MKVKWSVVVLKSGNCSRLQLSRNVQREAARAEHGPGQGSRYLPVRVSTLVISVADAIFVDTENLSPEQSLPS